MAFFIDYELPMQSSMDVVCPIKASSKHPLGQNWQSPAARISLGIFVNSLTFCNLAFAVQFMQDLVGFSARFSAGFLRHTL